MRHKPSYLLSLLVGIISLTHECRAVGPDHVGVDFQIPATQTDLERLQLLYSIAHEFPAVIQNGSSFGFDPIDVMTDQQRLIHELNQDPEYLELMRARPALQEITISQLSERRVREFSADPEQLRLFRERLESSLAPHSQIQEQILQTLNQLNRRSSEQMLNSLINSLPREIKVTAYRQPGFDARCAYLLHDPAISSEVRTQIPEIREIAKIEARLQQQVLVSILGQREPGTWLNETELGSRIRNLTDADVQLLFDYDHYLKPRFTAMNASIDQLQHHTAVKALTIDHAVSDLRDRVFTSSEKSIQADSNGLRLIELRPASAVFRGCAVGDCSTSLSFAAPNNPDELVFSVVSPKGEIKGYVEATRVLVNQDPTLYISSINGPRISVNDLQLILEGLYKERAALKVKQLATPTAGNVGSLMNYASIREEMKSLAKAGKPVELTFTSPRVRKKIEDFESRFLTANYDDMDFNHKAVLYTPPSDEALTELNTRSASLMLHPLTLSRNVTEEEMLSFAHEVDQALPGFFEKFVYRYLSSLAAGGQSEVPEKFKELLRDPKTVSGICMEIKDQWRSPASSKVAEMLIREGDPSAMKILLEKTFFNSHAAVRYPGALKLLIEKADSETLKLIVRKVFSEQFGPKEVTGYLIPLISKGDPATLDWLGTHYFSRPSMPNLEPELKLLIEKTNPDRRWFIAMSAFRRPESLEMKSAIRLLIQLGNHRTIEQLASQFSLVGSPSQVKEYFRMILEKGNELARQPIANRLLYSPGSTELSDDLALLIAKSSPSMRANIEKSISDPKSQWHDAQYQWLRDAAKISDSQARERFLIGHVPNLLQGDSVDPSFCFSQTIRTLLERP